MANTYVMTDEAKIAWEQNVLLYARGSEDQLQSYQGFQSLTTSFCGRVSAVDTDENASSMANQNQNVYLCGNIGAILHLFDVDGHKGNIYVVQDLAWNIMTHTGTVDNCVLNIGQVPVSVHDVGVFFPQFYPPSIYDQTERGNIYNRIKDEHVFQSLTESNKAGTAFRTGIYLSPVASEGDRIHFQLLRCSSNLGGPTENFRETDREIVSLLNNAREQTFTNSAPFNHVLAQEYHNPEPTKKAKIKEHSDKTEDMSSNALIAFVTFYDAYQNGEMNLPDVHRSDTDSYDWCYGKSSVLTRLQFRLKDTRRYPDLQPTFTVPLYPNSAFFIPLSTNRLYRHEIRPSALDARKIPVRIGYVVRNSCRPAYYDTSMNLTYIAEQSDGHKGVLLKHPTDEEMGELREMYRSENIDTVPIRYPAFDWSFNMGDFLPPACE